MVDAEAHMVLEQNALMQNNSLFENTLKWATIEGTSELEWDKIHLHATCSMALHIFEVFPGWL